jgi:WD40 repeat protein
VRFLEFDLTTGNAAIKHGKPAQGADVVSLCFGRSESEVIVAKKNGHVAVLLDGVPFLSVSGFSTDLVGASTVNNGERESLLCLTVDGKVFSIDFSETSPVDVSARPTLFQVQGPLETFAVRGSLLAVGGKENRLRVWDVALKQRVFEARNSPDDWLCLKVPMWISGLKFAPRAKGESERVAIVTRHRDLQLFDLAPEHDRRPVWKRVVGDDALNCVAFSQDGKTLYCGSATGVVYVVDALQGVLIGRMSPSSAGSIRDVVCFGKDLVLAVGLDRFVYGYRADLCTSVHKVYAKQRLCRVLVANSLSDEGEKKNEDEDDDDAWFGLPSRKGFDNVNNDDDKEEKIVEEKRASHSSMERALEKLKSKTKKPRHHL